MAEPPLTLRPMLASLADAPLVDPELIYEPKYDGIRAIAEVGARVSVRDAKTRAPVRLWSRLGNEKTHQFPEITAALAAWARRLTAPVILDGEIVALDANGQPTGFQQLQRRIHTSETSSTSRSPRSLPSPNRSRASGPSVGFMVFDILREGPTDLRNRPLLERRAIIERVFSFVTRGRVSVRGTETPPHSIIRISEMTRGDGRALYERALASGWEGLIAKQANSVYQSGKRTPDWRKLKIVHEQEFVIGGWTDPRHTRSHFGALLLGVYEPHRSQSDPSSASSAIDGLVYVGHTGTGFDEGELGRVMKLLEPLETSQWPFRERPKTNERPHWVKPKLVAEIKFTEWTADGKLRHPVYLGLRDDKKPEAVVREPETRLHATSARGQGSRFRVRASGFAEPRTPNPDPETSGLIDDLREMEEARRDGALALADGGRLSVTNLHKVFWPMQKLTKGDLFRYYVEVARYLLPAVADRPLVMKRYPNGIGGQPFYQHRVQDVPHGVRVETVNVADTRQQIVGGSLTTLLYMTQLAAVSQDPWFSRVKSVQSADYIALDLDPSAGVTFSRVLDVARWIRDELDTLGAAGVPKTSGADGLHVYVPLPSGTSYDAGLLFCQIIATVVARKHPKIATVERSVRARGPRVYVDYLQNILGKTLATAYSARASEYAGVSTPLSWQEVDRGVRREDFTIETVPARLREVGDLWAALSASKGVDLSRAARYADRTGSRRLKETLT